MGKIYRFLASLNLGLWLMGGIMLLFALGSFVNNGENAAAINDLPLFEWLRQAPLAASWWLWGAVVLLALLVLNTLFCGFDTLRRKYRLASLLLLLAPQLMHAGFLLIIVAHLASASGGRKDALQVFEGTTVPLPGGGSFQVERLSGEESPMGFLTAFSADLRCVTPSGESRVAVSPNHPFFYDGFGFYLKEVVLSPQRTALMEIHREPGAPWALAGALLFVAGNLVLLVKRR